MIHRIRIKKHEIGLRFYRGEFAGLVGPGKHWLFGRVAVKVVSGRDVYLRHEQLDLIVKSGALAGKADVYELTDTQRALVWIDGRFNAVLGPGLHALWTGYRRVRVEVVDIARVRLAHADLEAILAQRIGAGLPGGPGSAGRARRASSRSTGRGSRRSVRGATRSGRASATCGSRSSIVARRRSTSPARKS